MVDFLTNLGNKLSSWLKGELSWNDLDEAILLSSENNIAFTPSMQRRAIASVADCFLSRERLLPWIASYERDFENNPPLRGKKVGIIAAGNIPMVATQDIVCALLSGAEVVVKLSSKDNYLLRVLFSEVVRFLPRKEFEKETIDALITMGSDATGAEVEKRYFGVPSLIRKSRFSAALIDHQLKESEYEALADDIMLYWGLGCRSITYLIIREDFDFDTLADCINKKFGDSLPDFFHNAYLQNRAIMAINGEHFIDGHNLLFKETKETFLPLSVVGYSLFHSENDVHSFLEGHSLSIQKIFSIFGVAQRPYIDDFPDGVDTMRFLLNLN